MINRIRFGIPYFYLLRIQLLALTALLRLPWWWLRKFLSLLGGLFDVHLMDMAYVTLAALLTTWTQAPG